MTWATLAILLMARHLLPTWRATIAAGLLTGLAIGTRTGGIITHVYVLGALCLCAVQFAAERGRPSSRYLLQLAARFGAVVALGWLTAIALWPWLQLGNPFEQFKIALLHFATISTVFEFTHWGEHIWTNALPPSYIPGQLAARLPEAFLGLLGVAFAYAAARAIILARNLSGTWGLDRNGALQTVALALSTKRAMIVICAAVVLPIAFLIVQRATLYDAIRHVMFVIPMLAVVAGAGMTLLLPLLRRAPAISAVVGGVYVGNTIMILAVLHPLQYIVMNAFAGGIRGAYGRFELDYLTVAGTEALRRLEYRLDYDRSLRSAETPPSILVCIPWREQVVAPILRRPWIVETDPDKADFIIETERWRCAKNLPVTLIDEVKRFDRAFAWTYARHVPSGLMLAIKPRKGSFAPFDSEKVRTRKNRACCRSFRLDRRGRSRSTANSGGSRARRRN
jgi:hypothetical protein